MLSAWRLHWDSGLWKPQSSPVYLHLHPPSWCFCPSESGCVRVAMANIKNV